jgi:A/G-specific adenine glycosylase
MFLVFGGKGIGNAALCMPVAANRESKTEKLQSQLAAWFSTAARDLPWRRTRDPYAILVSEFMLQQTQVATVIPYFERWMQRFPTFAALAAARENDVLSAWQGLGYYSRARRLHTAARAVVENHGGTLPPDPAAISALPGVGAYTAGAIAAFAFDLPAPAVDANIARVLSRLFHITAPIDTTAGRDALWAAATRLVPQCGAGVHTGALMELGALVCTPRAPRCLECPIRTHCRAPNPEDLPVKRPRPSTIALEENCAFILSRGRILLSEQTGPRWRGLWKLPPLEIPPAVPPVHTAVYPFTRHRITLRVWTTHPPKRLPPAQKWFPLGSLPPMASAHARAVGSLGVDRSSFGC